jgi:hypothetical protein
MAGMLVDPLLYRGEVRRELLCVLVSFSLLR